MFTDIQQSTLRQRPSATVKSESSAEFSPQQQQQLQRLSQTAAELLADSMLSSTSTTSVKDENLTGQTTTTTAQLQSRLTDFQQQQYNNRFDTYHYPKKSIDRHSVMQKKTSQSMHSLEQLKPTTSTIITSPTAGSKRNSAATPLRSMATGKFYTKRGTTKQNVTTRRSFSESSAERQLHKKYTSSDSDSSQGEEDELMMSLTAASEKRKMTRRGVSNGLHKYKNLPNGEEDDVSGCVMFGRSSQNISDLIDIGIRVVLVIVFCNLETQTAFKRVIHAEEMWMYKNPPTNDYVSPLSLILAVIFGPLAVTLLNLMLTKDRRDFRAASWTWTLCLGLNGLVTSLLKISVGRPRPDFFFRCFPDGIMHLNANATASENLLDLFNCTGNFHDINEGRKSFPSGHSSFAFVSFGFITFYVGAKLNAFNRRGRGETWRLFVSLAPLALATLISVSRTCDYHHHWEDVTVGSIIGLVVSYFVYRQYYPSIFLPNCHRPFNRSISVHTQKAPAVPEFVSSRHRRRLHSYKRLPSEECGEGSFLFGAHTGDHVEKRPLVRDQ